MKKILLKKWTTDFFKKGNYSACNVILEEVIEDGTNDINAITLYSKGLLKENSIEISDSRMITPTLENVFMYLIKEAS